MPTLKLLKDMSKEELEKNYQTMVVWTVERESSMTEKGKLEFQAGLRRIEDYERELQSRGYNESMLRELYVTVVFDGKVPSNVH